MNVNRQAARSAATREKLIAAARPLFAERGYANVGTEEIVRSAGVTRGALYHQFKDKLELFAAVVEALDRELIERVMAQAATADDPVAGLQLGLEGWLDASTDPEVQRILLLDAPAALGYERLRAMAEEAGLGVVAAVLQAAMDEGALAKRPVRPLADIIVGAVDDGALFIARADDPEQARREVSDVLNALLDGLRS